MAKKIFISYAHADAERLDRLHKHLAQLKREGKISEWFDREIQAGDKFDAKIDQALNAADIFIAAMSPDFIASSYCIDIELKHALEMEAQGSLRIVPVIFEPCDWASTPLAKFKALPQDGKPVADFSNENNAFLSVINELRRLIDVADSSDAVRFGAQAHPAPIVENTSKYRIKRDFDAIDKRDFLEKSFSEIKKHFFDFISEINTVPDIEAKFSELDENRFSCVIVNRGLKRSFETLTVQKGGPFGDININYGDRPNENTSHGGFVVNNDEYKMYLRSRSHAVFGSADTMLSASDAAKSLWDEFLSRVGIDYA